MDITLYRTRLRTHTCDGTLYIGEEKICNTAENNMYKIPHGIYSIKLLYSKKHTRKMPTLIEIDPFETEPLDLKHGTFPVIAPGNGIYNVHDGTILIGKTLIPGVVTNSSLFFQRFYNRIYTAIRRGATVTLIITNSYKTQKL